MTLPARHVILGTPISEASIDAVLTGVRNRPKERALSVAFCNVHTVMSSRRDGRLARALADMDLTMPDGRPVAWALRLLTGRTHHARGADSMRAVLGAGVEAGWRHYFFGSTSDTLARLTESVQQISPEIAIAGTESPPFRQQTDDELEASLAAIQNSGADLVWVGLGMPKQELWIAKVADRLPGVVLLGVGAAFDYLAGTVTEAPPILRRVGFEWLFRLLHEPRRLWSRYAWNNPAFLVLLTGQVLAERVYAKRSRTPAS